VAIANKYQAAEALRLRAHLENAKLEMVREIDFDGSAFDMKEGDILCFSSRGVSNARKQVSAKEVEK
jgi:hypothetical protein